MSSTRACRNVHGSDKRRAILGANPLMTLTRGRTRIPTEWRHNSLPYGFCMRMQTAFVLLPLTGSSLSSAPALCGRIAAARRGRD